MRSVYPLCNHHCTFDFLERPKCNTLLKMRAFLGNARWTWVIPKSHSRQHAWCNRRQHGLDFIFSVWCPSKYDLDLWCPTEAAAINDTLLQSCCFCLSSICHVAMGLTHSPTHVHTLDLINPLAHAILPANSSGVKYLIYLFLFLLLLPLLRHDEVWNTLALRGCGQGGRGSISTTPMHSNGPPTSGQLCNNCPITWRDEAAAQVFWSAAAKQVEPSGGGGGGGGGVCGMCNAVDETAACIWNVAECVCIFFWRRK